MTRMIFVNLPVKDLSATRAFWSGLGYTFNETYSDDNCCCMVVSDAIYAMFLRTEFFATFTDRPVADGLTSTQVLLCLTEDSRDGVDALVDEAVRAGGKEVREPMDGNGMYGRSFADPDGHIWEIMWSAPDALPA